MTGSRRLSQAISEGDGISLIVPATDLESVQVAEEQGAEGVVVERDLFGVREATGLPILWRREGSPADALKLGADACLVVAEGLEEDAERLERRFAEALDLGLECVVEVSDTDDLELALERLDPEIFLLSPQDDGDGDEPLARVLDLLPDLPAGKLAIADLLVTSRDDVAELERAGVDAVIVGTSDVSSLVSAAPPEV
jgi:indole-3-glycerol phosphate synthase